MNAHNFIKLKILQHAISCIFLYSHVRNQEGNSSTNIFLLFSACNRAAENSSMCIMYVVDGIVHWT